MRRSTCFAVLLAAALGLQVAAVRADMAPAVVYDVGGTFDGAFNERVRQGLERFTAETGIPVLAAEPQSNEERADALERFARDGRSPILAVGYAQASAVADVASRYPELSFDIIDAEVDLPNVRSILFHEHEAAYLAGLLAALASTSGTIGFVGGMDIPVIRAFACGFRQGAHSIDPDVTVLEVMAGTTGEAWSDPLLGAELARQHMDRGADVVFHAAGGTGLGVLEAMARASRLGIGVDSNQNGFFPGHVLTSVEKRVDVAAYDAAMDALDGTWVPGTIHLGLAEGGVDWALDDNNAPLIDNAMMAAVSMARTDIVEGRIVVHDYRTDLTCPE